VDFFDGFEVFFVEVLFVEDRFSFLLDVFFEFVDFYLERLEDSDDLFDLFLHCVEVD